MSNASLIQTAGILKALSDAVGPEGLHIGQQVIIQALFGQGKDLVQVDCGRKFGKTELLLYVLHRWALERPGGYYYIAPFQKQAKELIWAPQRIQNFLPEFHAKKPNDSEMRITLTNGSFIKLDGADNYVAYRGINPHGMAYDEFKDHRPEFHEAMGPNLATYQAPCLIVGTPPDQTEMPTDDNQDEEALANMHSYDLMMKTCQEEETAAYFNFPTWVNPHISRDWLKREKRKLTRRGELAQWYREYEAKRVHGGKDNLFPMIDLAKHVHPHDSLMEEIAPDMHHLSWMAIADPGSSSTFGMLYSAVNLKTKTVYWLDELYLRQLSETRTANVVKLHRGIKHDLHTLNPRFRQRCDWDQVYDEAGLWFANEANGSFGETFRKTSKAQNRKDDGLSLIKDQLIFNKVKISTRCKYLVWEIVNYKRDPKTKKIPKENDHLIDCWRYGNAAVGFDLSTYKELYKDPHLAPRFTTPESDFDLIDEQSGNIPVEVEAELDDYLWET